jgi:hypothetical protein
MSVMYPDIFNPIGHRFGLLVSERLILNRSTAHCISVLFKCDCGKHRKVSTIQIKRKKVPFACEKCERETGNEWRNYNRPVTETAFTGKMGRKEYSEFIKRHYSLFTTWANRRKLMVTRWKESFVRFVADMAPRPDGKVLCRHSLRGKHGPHNSYWGVRGQDSAKGDFNLNGVPVNADILYRDYSIRKHFTRHWRRMGLTPAGIITKWNETYGSTGPMV